MLSEKEPEYSLCAVTAGSIYCTDTCYLSPISYTTARVFSCYNAIYNIISNGEDEQAEDTKITGNIRKPDRYYRHTKINTVAETSEDVKWKVWNWRETAMVYIHYVWGRKTHSEKSSKQKGTTGDRTLGKDVSVFVYLW